MSTEQDFSNTALIQEIIVAVAKKPGTCKAIYAQCKSAPSDLECARYLRYLVARGDIVRDDKLVYHPAPVDVSQTAGVTDASTAPHTPEVTPVAIQAEQVAHALAHTDDMRRSAKEAVLAYLRALLPLGASRSELIAVFDHRSASAIDTALWSLRKEGSIETRNGSNFAVMISEAAASVVEEKATAHQEAPPQQRDTPVAPVEAREPQPVQQIATHGDPAQGSASLGFNAGGLGMEIRAEGIEPIQVPATAATSIQPTVSCRVVLILTLETGGELVLTPAEASVISDVVQRNPDLVRAV